MSNPESAAPVESIAVIGMTGRFPGARTIDQFWSNLLQGVETITRFSDEELSAAGVDPSLAKVPGFVNAGSVLSDIDQFDAVFFGYSARDAEGIDPQHRLFLECAWDCLEGAGYDSDAYPGLIGVFGGSDMSSYLYQVYANLDPLAGSGMVVIGNDKDYLTTQVSYKLNLKGPSIAVQTSCSTSLVAVCLACQNLWSYGCDMALAGGVSVAVPQKKGYYYMPGGIVSPDGHCRTFDAEGQGTVIGNGVGIVLLKRLSDALADGDTIHAVIKGAALNNDGSAKVGYTAPSIAGQAQVIAMAQAMAGVDPETITYVEAHGTATLLGDPIEVAALTQAFSTRTSKKRFCGLGSVKSNVGHLASAAGVTGLIKTVLSLKEGVIPPTLNFRTPNPQIDFDSSPFYVNDTLREWERNGGPRRAGVSSFGVGGTNAHVVLEEAPPLEPSGPSRPWQLITVSAKSGSALESATANLATYLKTHPDTSLADVSYSQAARRPFAHRRMLVTRGGNTAAAAAALDTRDPQVVMTGGVVSTDRPVLFMFSGQGSQYVDMGRELYDTEPVFRSTLDGCCELLEKDLGFDLRGVMYPEPAAREEASARLLRTATTQPALFALEYSLAKLWMELGVDPKAMIGHSIGEYVCACLSGVLSLEDALSLVSMRGRLMDQMPAGAMLAVPLSEQKAQAFLGAEISLAVVNAPGLCVFSGPHAAIDALTLRLSALGVQGRKLHTSHAFHSSMMDPIVRPFVQKVQSIRLNAPQIPYLSNVTGTWMTAEDALDPNYWGRHLRQTVRFADGLVEVLKYPELMLLEVGPGVALSTLARQQPSQAGGADRVILSSTRSPLESGSDEAFFLTTLGQLWLNGAPVNWSRFYAGERRRRIPLPTYPFERQRYWIGPVEHDATARVPRESRDVSQWFYTPVWRERLALPPARGGQPQRWLVFGDESDSSQQVTETLEREGHDVWVVTAGEQFAAGDAQTFMIRPHESADYERVVKALRADAGPPDRVLHLWTVPVDDSAEVGPQTFDLHQSTGFYSLVFLAQAFHKQNVTTPVQIAVVSSELHVVAERDRICPSKSTLLGACKVLPQEYSNLQFKSIDIGDRGLDAAAVGRIVDELTSGSPEPMVAHRAGRWFVQEFNQTPLGPPPPEPVRLRRHGVYLITGGLGNIGLEIAQALAEQVQARLVLTGRSEFPPRSSWEQRLTAAQDDSVNRKIRRLMQIEALGSEVLIVKADSADRTQMTSAVRQAYERFGVVSGVIHGAGNTSGAAFVEAGRVDRASGDQHFRPKAYGAFVLEEIFRDRDVDFVLLLSSLSGVLGGLGLLGYASANVFLDAFAARENQAKRVRWIAVNWDAWQFPGQEAMFRQSASPGGDFLYPAEGIDCFRRIIEHAPPQVVVSTSDLNARIAKWVLLESLRPKAVSQKAAGATQHPRPSLSTQFVPPRNDIETTIAEIWQTILGIAPIGIYDRFFELGGHSLLAIQLISRMREAFRVELSAQRLFEAPTIAELAVTIDADVRALRAAEEEEAARSEEMLRMVEQLSEDEVAALLATQDGPTNAESA